MDSKEVMEIESAEGAPSYYGPSMDTSDVEKNVMAPGATGSVTCSLHPLVIMNVSEHWTRVRAQAEGLTVPRGEFVYVCVGFKVLLTTLHIDRSM